MLPRNSSGVVTRELYTDCMKKRIPGQARDKALSFRPTAEMKKALEAKAAVNTRSLADQIEHYIKIGRLVETHFRSDNIDYIQRRLNGSLENH